jgi:chromosome segregation ATPase
MFVSENGKTEKFVKWATESLFTLQMGTDTQKHQIVREIMGVRLDVLREVIKAYISNLPGIYLFTLGTVKELRESMNIDEKYSDDMIVCKYGRSDSVMRRMGEHEKEYGKIEGVSLKLKYYAHIDESLASKAETDVKNFFTKEEMLFKYKKYKELVIINEKQFNNVKKQYEKVEKNHSGRMKETIEKMKELTNKLDNLEKLKDTKEKSYEKEIELLNNQHAELKTQYTELKTQYTELKTQYDSTIAELRLQNKNNEKKYEKMEKKYEKTIAEEKTRNEKLEIKIERLENKNDKLENDIEQLRTQIREYEKQLKLKSER